MKKLDPEKIEIIVNEPCIFNCHNRAAHYRLIANASSDVYNIEHFETVKAFVRSKCRVSKQITHEEKTRNCRLTQSEVKHLYDAGFRHFKIQGRSDAGYLFFYDLCEYILEKDFTAPLFYKSYAQFKNTAFS